MNKLIYILFLILAVITETVATISFKHPVVKFKYLNVLIGYGGYLFSVFILSKILKFLPVGTVYAMWAGLGIVITFVFDILLYDESYTIYDKTLIFIILVCIIMLNFSNK